jgi:hypothetical protein
MLEMDAIKHAADAKLIQENVDLSCSMPSYFDSFFSSAYKGSFDKYFEEAGSTQNPVLSVLSYSTKNQSIIE